MMMKVVSKPLDQYLSFEASIPTISWDLFSCVSSSTIFALKLWKAGEGEVLGSVSVDQSPCLYALSDSLSHFHCSEEQ